MPKKRMISPDIWSDAKFAALEPLARLLFIGMWNYACDNGHLDDNALQIKMRVLPGDSCDVTPLIEALIDAGMVTRSGGYLKIVKLTKHQTPDLRFLVLCEHCEDDENRAYTEGDRRARHGSTKSARSAPIGRTKGALRNGGVDVDVDVDGGGAGGGTPPRAARGAAAKPTKSKPAETGTRIPDDFAVTDPMRTWATTQHLDHLDLDAITEEFFDYWRARPGKDGRKLDWVATWRNWVRREDRSRPRSATRGVSSEDRIWGDLA